MTPEALRALISRAGLTQADAAEQLGVNRRTVLRWLAGDTVISHRIAVLIRAVLRPKK